MRWRFDLTERVAQTRYLGYFDLGLPRSNVQQQCLLGRVAGTTGLFWHRT